MRKAKNNLLSRLFASLNKEVYNYQESQNPDSGKKQLSRRNFISQSAKASAAITIGLSLPGLLSSCRETGTDQKDSSNKLLDVAILGGGMAGLNCANHLLNSGLNFKVFEGSERFGGRILTHYNDAMQLGIFPEFGGDFVDSDHEDMISLAKEFKLDLLDLIEEQEENHWIKDIFFFDNRSISEKEIIKEFNKIAPKIAKDVASLGEDYDTEAAIKLDNTPLSDYIKSLDCAQWLKDLFVAAFVAEYGLDCEEQSTINMLDMIETDTKDGFYVFGTSDERFRIKGGNSKVIEGLVDKIGKEKIATNFAVKDVEELKDGTYSIHFENEDPIFAKTIVCTIPFTILRNLNLNLANMAPEKRKCIAELGYGNNTKIILGYDGLPWRSKENNAMGYLFTNDMTNGWDASVNKTENNPNGAYVAYFGGDYSQKLCDQSFKNPMAPPSHVWRTELPKERVNGFVDELDKIFKHSKEKFQGKHVFVNWIEYPWVKGSYSCYKVGQWSTISGWEMEPVGNFFFAGEHCSEMFQGFMNGAAETGRRVAISVVNALKEKEMKTAKSENFN
ncbi:MAG TPA: FAD-dependent oxidoreductase [Edaphocola sp.]|nr:FAD-dependent oxidoreductase [Edaphocola sp.]